MRKRVGFILLCTGLVLLFKPNFDFEQIMMTFNYVVANYWPIGFVAIGVMLLWPQTKYKSHPRSRT